MKEESSGKFDEFMDKFKKQSGIMSELRKINNPNSLLSEKKKLSQKSENSNSSEKSTPTMTPVKPDIKCAAEASSPPETKNTTALFDSLNIKLEDINLPPEKPEKPERSRKSTDESRKLAEEARKMAEEAKKLAEETKKSMEEAKKVEMAVNEPPPPPPVSEPVPVPAQPQPQQQQQPQQQSTMPEPEVKKPEIAPQNVDRVSTVAKEDLRPKPVHDSSSDYCSKLTTIPNNLPLPNIGNAAAAYENHIK